ncbi:ABC transporter substrate-binding protein [Ruania alba]|uniref:Carbohydrate ABC transporter substrate-binding protein, CUT1 family n=1 Tax=Ruania alba TaxID=648782 RepID=A0A1H5NCJ8_9MICO|nr:extracellular solute-binding protein [Ruania alba]SEE99234.1 carbohydrate ABC transporter substrate-binding protein, CUT1 family [Ruania alba]
MRSTPIAALAVLTSAALALAACSGGSDGNGNDNGNGSADGGDTSEVTLDFFTDKAAWEPSFDDMNAASDGVAPQLSFTGYSDPTAYDAFIKQSFRTNERPDLFTWHTGDRLGELVEQGLVAETTEIWDQAIADGFVTEELAQSYTYDGKQYCVPLHVVYWVMYYNTEIFAEHDLEVPTTWEEFTAVADALVEAGVVPLHQMNIIFEFVWFQAILAGSDLEAYHGLSDGSVSYTDPPVVEAMDTWHQMQSDGYFIDPGVTTDPQTLLQTGETAMAYFGTFFTGQLTDLGMASGEDYGMFVLPSVNPEMSETPVAVETGPLCVGTDSENQQAALDYSAWWMGTEAQSAWSESRGDVSFNPNATVTDEALAEITAQVTGEGHVQYGRYLEATPNTIYTVAAEEFGAFVTNNDDPMGHLEAIQAEADAYWAEQ